MNYAIGIDVGKKEMVACIRSSKGLTGDTISIPNSNTGVEKFLSFLEKKGITRKTPILVESTGPYHWCIAKRARETAWNIKVINPILTKRIVRHSIRKLKTDKVDSRHLAFLASQGYGYSFRETADMTRLKALIRHYWKMVILQTNCRRHEEYLKVHHRFSRLPVANYLNRYLKKLKGEIIEQYGNPREIGYLDSIPGVTPLLAISLRAELQPLGRFHQTKQLIAYAGLDPAVKQSGMAPVRFSRLSKRGSSVLRKILFFAAFGAFHHGPFKPLYDRYKQRGLHHTTVLCIIARKILRIAVTLIRKKEFFNEQLFDRT